MSILRDQYKKHWLRLRFSFLLAGFGLFFFLLLLRAADLQLLQRDELYAKAQNEFMRQVELEPRRGVIFDRNQEELAVSLDTESINARPLLITTPKETGTKLAQALNLKPREVISRLTSEQRFVWIARRVSPDKAQAVRELSLKGVEIRKEPRRFYPYSDLACHVLGFAGLDAKGLEGLEAQYNQELKGQSKKSATLRDAIGRTIHLSPEDFQSLPEGHNLILTIDKQLQYQAEKILARTVAKYKALGGQVVVMLPSTGEVLALVANPAFNPNVFQDYPRQTYRNRVITDPFEPGSTFKMFVTAAALTSGKVSQNDNFYCEQGAWKIGGRVIHDTHPYGNLNMAGILKVSSNIGSAKMGQVVGAETLHATFQDFGFGQPTEIDLPGESRGILRNHAKWRPVDLANICFGHGIAVTGLQLTQAVAAIANGGVLMRPYLVQAVTDKDARLISETQPMVVRRVMSPRQARLLCDMLEGVVEPGGTAQYVKVAGFNVAGKTGTAQKVMPGGGYSQTDYIANFVGFAPAEDPQVVVLVTVDTPRGAHFGSTVAGPAWAEIIKIALDRLGVTPEEYLLRQAKARRAGPDFRERPQLMPNNEEIAQQTALNVMPDLAGLTMRSALNLAQVQGWQLEIKGWGRVVSQSPAKGQNIEQGKVMLTLQPSPGGA